MDASILEEQKRYYDARAEEYDEWWERRGKYDLGPEGNREWEAGKAAVLRLMDALPWSGEILELAAGTGYWTAYFASRAERVHVVDASAPMISVNRRRLSRAGLDGRVSFEQADLFAWAPTRAYDGVFAGFWISHVPAGRLQGHFTSVAKALQPGGVFAFLEGHGGCLRSPKQGTSREGEDIERRTVNDGRTFRIVKREMDFHDLEPKLETAGFGVRFEKVPQANFLLTVATRR